MSLGRNLKTLEKDIVFIQKKISQAVRIRGKILERISRACTALQTDPSNEAARRSLIINLERERKFLDIVREGSKGGVEILNATLSELKKIEAEPNVKSQMAQLIQFLIDAMEYTKGKIKVIEKRMSIQKDRRGLR